MTEKSFETAVAAEVNDGEPRFSLFPASITNVRPAKEITVCEAWEIITMDMDALNATHELRKYDPVAQRDERRRLKGKLFRFVTFSGTFSYRNMAGFKQHSQLICIDIDHVGESRVPRLKQQLALDPEFETALCFRSPSGDGVKWVVAIDTWQAAHEVWFNAIYLYLKNVHGLEADKACRDITRPCYLPHDPFAIIGEQFKRKIKVISKQGVHYEEIPF